MENAALAADELVAVRLNTAQGTRRMIAAGAISADAAVYAAASGRVASSGTIFVGEAITAATAAGDVIEVAIIVANPPNADRMVWSPDAIVMDHADATENVVIVAGDNPNGYIVNELRGIITEAMVGDTEDQMIVTLYDEDDNALDTLTPSDAAADAIGDIVQGPLGASQTATGAIPAVIPANKGAYIKVTQTTDDATPANEAGAYSVTLVLSPLT
jgi:hypothetical protein